MKIGIVLDNSVNKWGLQRFEPIGDEHDITVFIGERNKYDVSAIKLKKHLLRHKEERLLALKSPLATYRRVLGAPYRKMDFYYFSLNKYLENMDIVYTSDTLRSAYTLASMKDKFGYKLIVSWWENIPYKAVFDAKETFIKRFVLEKADLILPYTETAARSLRLEGIPDEKLKVVYPGVDTDKFTPGPKPADILSANKIDAGSFVVLYVGQLASWKGVHNLVYSAKVLKQKNIAGFTIAIAGKGAQRENMEKMIKESGTEEHFRFLDFISYDRIPDIHRAADVFVLPSYPTMNWQEQFGFVLVEAMACGKPVISTASGSIPEVVGNAGVVIPPGDYEAMANSILLLMNDKGLRERLGECGRQRAVRLFSSAKKAKELSMLLSGL